MLSEKNSEQNSSTKKKSTVNNSTSKQANSVPLELKPVILAMKAINPSVNSKMVVDAYQIAKKVHSGQVRKSGEPYIIHPIAVALILAELGMSAETVSAGLLHDTVEDTDYTLDSIRKKFGESVATMVDGVTKLQNMELGKNAKAETARKMIVSMAKDIRVLVIKLADRLHNARTWKFVSNAKAKAKETLEIYAPLAHRLGMNSFKWELEDLSFKTLHPKIYEEIVDLIAKRAPAREEYLNIVSDQIQEDLKKADINAKITGREKEYYSIYQKMVVRGHDIDDIYDLVGIRVLVSTIQDCYSVLGLVHNRWSPVQGRFKDYIAMPKFNMYQSLHTTVVGPSGKFVEVQIRTYDMHRHAEYGVAAHWKYKRNPNAKSHNEDVGGSDSNSSKNTKMENDSDSDVEFGLKWLKQIAELQKETEDSAELLESLKHEMETDSFKIYVFTPNGDVIDLPPESTPVDLAYAVHTEVGKRAVGARVNSRMVALSTKLNNGDVVEIITNKAQDAAPSRDWLDFVKSPRAKSKIKNYYTKERREEAVEKAKADLAKEAKKQNFASQKILSSKNLDALISEMNYEDVNALFVAIGEGHISAHNIVAKLVQQIAPEEIPKPNEELQAKPSNEIEIISKNIANNTQNKSQKVGNSGVIVSGITGVSVKIAKCCSPVPGDEIIGFITHLAGVSVHNTKCENAIKLSKSRPERIVQVSWGITTDASFEIRLQLEAIDRNDLLNDVTSVFKEMHVNIRGVNSNITKRNLILMDLRIEIADLKQINYIINSLKKIDGVFEVHRMSGI